MKTSASQFELMVDYMQSKGDLSKPLEGPNGRLTLIHCWAELTEMLNSDATGDTKTSEKWRKVWSDLKNNTKRKAARCYQAAIGAGGGPTSKTKLSVLEQRILNIVGLQATTGITEMLEVGIDENVAAASPSRSVLLPYSPIESPLDEWNQPGSSSTEPISFKREVSEAERACTVTTTSLQNTSSIPSAHRHHSVPTTSTPAAPKRFRRLERHNPVSSFRRRPRMQTQSDLVKQVINSDRKWREYQRERDRNAHEIEVERLRLHNIELQQQARWQEIAEKFIQVLNKMNDKY